MQHNKHFVPPRYSHFQRRFLFLFSFPAKEFFAIVVSLVTSTLLFLTLSSAQSSQTWSGGRRTRKWTCRSMDLVLFPLLSEGVFMASDQTEPEMDIVAVVFFFLFSLLAKMRKLLFILHCASSMSSFDSTCARVIASVERSHPTFDCNIFVGDLWCS